VLVEDLATREASMRGHANARIKTLGITYLNALDGTVSLSAAPSPSDDRPRASIVEVRRFSSLRWCLGVLIVVRRG
jgi:hypothetical protein